MNTRRESREERLKRLRDMQQALILAHEEADLRLMHELQTRELLLREVRRREAEMREERIEREKTERPEKDKST